MKKTFTFIAVLSLVLSLQSFSQVQFGIKGGLNLAKITLKDLGGATQKMLPSFHIGAIVDYNTSNNVALEAGLFVSGKGTKLEATASDGGISVTGKESISPLYIEIPINAVYKVDLGTSKLRLFAGPYLGFGISGKIKEEYTATGLPAGTTLASLGFPNTSTDIKYGTGTDSNLKSTDFGINIGAGIELSKLMISAQYGLGLTNLDPQGSSDNDMKNRVIGISVGFLFGGK